MKIQFFGGAGTVTGSQHLLTINGTRILLECGMFQGRRSETYERNQNFSYDPASVDTLILSHAHIDHSGNIPNLVKKGFKGPIIATGATVDLCQIMLRDSAYIQEKDIEWINKKRRKNNESPVFPLYTTRDAEESMERFMGLEYGKEYELDSDIKVTFRDAGHILGSAGVLIEFREPGSSRNVRFGFTGDLGRRDIPVLKDPDYLRDLDVLVMESTYGNRTHAVVEDIEEHLAELIREVSRAGGKIIIPAFAVGRTQLLVYMIHKLHDQNRIPDIPVFVDSPMAVNTTEVFRRHPECLDREARRIYLKARIDPFGYSRLQYIRDVKQSKELNQLNYPHIIISASGMAEGGRILHHLRNNISNPRNVVLLVGYAAQHTLARRLMDGEKTVRIFGEEHTVNCRVVRMDDFSAHADRKGLLEFVKIQSPEKLKHIFLVHGEADQVAPLKNALRSLGFPGVYFPAMGDSFDIP